MIGKDNKMAKNGQKVKKERVSSSKVAARILALVLAILMLGSGAAYGLYMLLH